jgi:hypothetical protein
MNPEPARSTRTRRSNLRDIDGAAAAIEVQGARYREHMLKMVGR